MLGSVEPLKLARSSRVMSGEVALRLLEGFSKLLLSDEGVVDYELSFSVDADGLVVLSGRLRTEVCVKCQRCMTGMRRVIESNFVLSPVIDSKAGKMLPDGYEPVLLVDGEIDLLGVVDEELILAVPISLMHVEGDRACVSVVEEGLVVIGGAVDEAVDTGGSKASPFAVLGDLQIVDVERDRKQ